METEVMYGRVVLSICIPFWSCRLCNFHIK